MDIKLDDLGDLSFSGGNLTVTSIGSEDLAQRLTIRLNTFLGEWFMNNEYGVDYFGKVFGKNRSKSAIDAIIQAEILKERDVLQIVLFASELKSDTYSCDFKIRTENGAITKVAVSVNTP